MFKKRILISLIFLMVTTNAQHNKPIKDHKIKRELLQQQQEQKAKKSFRSRKYQYGYINRDHSTNESMKHIAGIYGVNWLLYPLSQPKVFKESGSWSNYKRNFGQIVFDRDEPFWNWFVHPISGSQLYLYFRANGYDRINSLGMTFISSTLFEFTIEVYTEPASIQDIYQTPVLGSLLGVGLETLSMYLLNTGNVMGRFFGHAINPATLFWFYEGKIKVIPQTNFKNQGGLYMMAEF